MRGVLTGLHAQFGDALHVMTALADGAVQLVANAAEKLDASDGTDTSLKIIAVSPMPLITYRATVSDKTKLAHHWTALYLRMELPEPSSSAAAGYDEWTTSSSARCSAPQPSAAGAVGWSVP